MNLKHSSPFLFADDVNRDGLVITSCIDESTTYWPERILHVSNRGFDHSERADVPGACQRGVRVLEVKSSHTPPALSKFASDCGADSASGTGH